MPDWRNPRTVTRAKSLRRTMTPQEQSLWLRLRNRQLGAKFRRQEPVGPYVADFLCAEAMLIVEVDGGQHAGRSQEDESRTRFLEEQGFKVLRFWNNEITGNLEGVLETIYSELSRRKAPLPRGEGLG